MTRARAGISVLVAMSFALTAALLVSPASAKPPGRSPCAKVERRAKAQLKHGLRACTPRNAAACGASRWTRYRTALARKGCTSPDQIAGQLDSIVHRPSIIAVRSSGGSAGDLAARDAAAIASYRKLEPVAVKIRAAVSALSPDAGYLTATAAIAPLTPMMKDAFTDVLTEEAELGATEAKIWSHFATDWSLPSVIGQPLAVAMEELQIETRRLLGPAFSTELEELAATRGCEGDLVRDRLLARYGEAVADPAGDDAAAVDALGRFAAQLACLSAQQTDALDFALYRAHAKVSARLVKYGLGPVRPAFTRLVAPLALLVLDTVKHEGERALAWRWFVEQHDTLADTTARLGWPTDDVVWLYDRVEGRMVGFCTVGSSDGCLDLPALLDSLVDPNALGIGDCALSGMVSGGLRGPAGSARYACPSACSSAPPASPVGFGGIGSAGKSIPQRPSGPPPSGGSSLPWSNVTSNDVSTMQGYCGAGGGGAGGSGGGSGGGGSAGGQGPGLDGSGSMQQCVRDVLSGPRDPYGRFVQCVAAITGANDRLHSALAPLDLHGVPMDARCGLMGEAGAGSGSGSGTTPTTTPPTTTPTSTTPPTTDDRCEICSAIGDAIVSAVNAAADAVEKKSKTLKDGIEHFIDSLSPTDPLPPLSPEKPTGPSGVGAIVGYEWQLIKAAPIANEGARSVLDDRIAQYCASGDLSPGECKVMDNLPPDEKRNYLGNKGLKDCADPNECDSGCTSLNEQVMKRMQGCQQQLQDELTPDQGGPLDPIINPGPDATDGHVPADPLAACLIGADGAHGVDKTCGVVTCADGPAAARGVSQCCQAVGTGVGLSLDQIITATLCERAQCADGETTAVGGAGACGCGGPVGPSGGAGAPAPAPRPGPAR